MDNKKININATSWRSRLFRSRSQSLTATTVSRENYSGQQCVQDWLPQLDLLISLRDKN